MSRRINIFIWVVNDSAIITLNFIFIRNVIYLSYVKGIIFSRYVFTNNCIEFDREYILGYVKSCSTSFRYFLYLRISAISRYPRMKLDANSMLLEVVVGICARCMRSTFSSCLSRIFENNESSITLLLLGKVERYSWYQSSKIMDKIVLRSRETYFEIHGNEIKIEIMFSRETF